MLSKSLLSFGLYTGAFEFFKSYTKKDNEYTSFVISTISSLLIIVSHNSLLLNRLSMFNGYLLHDTLQLIKNTNPFSKSSLGYIIHHIISICLISSPLALNNIELSKKLLKVEYTIPIGNAIWFINEKLKSNKMKYNYNLYKNILKYIFLFTFTYYRIINITLVLLQYDEYIRTSKYLWWCLRLIYVLNLTWYVKIIKNINSL